MARRKQAAAEAVQLTPAEEAAPQAAQSAQPVEEPPRSEQSPRPFLADPFPFKTVNLGGAKVHFQHSRQAGEFQIRFGDGGKNDMPSDAVRDFIKSHKVEVETKDGEKKEVQLFHWNDNDRAWGMRIDLDNPETSRQTARRIFDDVARHVAEERGVAQEPGR